MSIRYFIVKRSCTSLGCVCFPTICRDYTDYAFYLPGGAGIRTVTAIITKRLWNPPKKISETLPVQWGAHEFGGGFDLETSVSFQEKVAIYNHQLLGLSYMAGAFIAALHTYCFCSYSWWLYSIQIFKTIVNVAKNSPSPPLKGFVWLGIPLIFRISMVGFPLPLSHHRGPQRSLLVQDVVPFPLQESKSFTWSQVGTTNFMGFLRKSIPDGMCYWILWKTCLPIIPQEQLSLTWHSNTSPWPARLLLQNFKAHSGIDHLMRKKGRNFEINTKQINFSKQKSFQWSGWCSTPSPCWSSTKGSISCFPVGFN